MKVISTVLRREHFTGDHVKSRPNRSLQILWRSQTEFEASVIIIILYQTPVTSGIHCKIYMIR